MRTLIIAEAGVNHNGDIKLAKLLIDEAVKAGVDYIKFQTFKAEQIVKKEAAKAGYQLKAGDNGESQFEMLKRLELSYDDHYELINYCREKGIRFLSTGFDIESIEFLVGIGLELIKIPSGEITNLPFLRKIGGYNKQVIMSTGMCTMEDIEEAIIILEGAGQDRDKITVLHCNTEYPTPFKDVNLKAMLAIAGRTGLRIGYSDHTLGIEVSIAAVALGATVIEKHFTIDRTLPGPDHAASLEPSELKSMTEAIRNIEMALGSELKKPSESELKNIQIVRKSIVAACPIKEGELFTDRNLAVKRPGFGMSPMKWDETIGKIAKQDFNTDEYITW